MPKRKTESEKTRDYIYRFLALLEANFKETDLRKKIPYKDLKTIVIDLNELFNDLFEIEPDEAGKLIRERFMPIIKKLLEIDKSEGRIDYQRIMKNAFRISSHSSLDHYMIYREWDEKDKFYLPRLNIMRGYIHYLQELTENPNFKLIICMMPSGYGKTFPEKISEAWAFGRDPTKTVLALCSNEDVVFGGSNLVRTEMKSEAFGEVFPKLKYNKDDKEYFLKETDSNWKLKDCKLLASYYADTVKSNVVGERASQRVHIDDLYADYKEALNQNTNEYFFNKYMSVWRKRFVQHKTAKICITGTLWASGDFIDRVVAKEQKENEFVKHNLYKYTWINREATIAIIRVPALDPVTGLSSCPELRSTKEILEDKDNMDDYLFETNFQQNPTDPEDLEFSWNNLRTYPEYPGKEGEVRLAVIDATRKSGKDFFAMPIHGKVMLQDGSYDYPLRDCIFTRRATNEMYEDVVDKIIEHHIVLLVIESNVTSELKANLERILHERDMYFCEIREKYNTEPKAERIELMKSTIKRKIIFPQKHLFAPKSDMGQFMYYLTTYNSNGRNDFDDSPDAEALFGKEIIEEGSTPQKITVFKRPF